jgi:ubiquinone/menaquinone biosynthesis C-methylase UbiE
MNTDERLIHELEHGKYLARVGAGEVWNWESPAGKVRWKRRVDLLSSVIEVDHQVLELGCGTGYFTRELAKLSIYITAIDLSPELIAEARKEVTAGRVDFQIQNAYQLTFSNDLFDAVVGSSVLHHLDIVKAVSEMYRVLKPGGHIAFTEPNMLNPQIALQKNIPWLKRKLGDSPDETAFFRWRLKKLLQLAGFEQIQIIPFDFLHPAVPQGIIPYIAALGSMAERTWLLKEIAGSLYISACKKK